MAKGALPVILMKSKGETLRFAMLVPAICLTSHLGLCLAGSSPEGQKRAGTIENDSIWKDTDGNEIWSNGGHIIRQGGTFYWAGYETRPKTGFRSIKLTWCKRWTIDVGTGRFESLDL